MKTIRQLNDGWFIRKQTPIAKIDVDSVMNEGWENWLPSATMPAQVHDILLENNLLTEGVLLGWAEEAEWIGDYDWLYRVDFDADICSSWLWFHGLDTLVDIYLNGELIGRHDDFYLSNKIDVTGKIKKTNTLILHFHNVKDYLETLPYPEEWHETVMKCKLIRKPSHDFSAGVTFGAEYQGAVPYYSPIGVYGKIELISVDKVEITDLWPRAILEKNLTNGRIEVEVTGLAYVDDMSVKLSVSDDCGQEIISVSQNGALRTKFNLEVDKPKLWYPRGFGEQPLYTVKTELICGGVVVDTVEKKVGFRHIEMPYPLAFTVNGKKVRLWGGCMDPFQGWTHCLIMERVTRLLDMVENANMNTLRIWGEGIPQSDEFYEECDRRGIIVWQEFFLGWNAYPDTKRYRQYYKAEAEELIIRLRHHACLFMYSGGNETIMGSEFVNRSKPVYALEVLTEDFPRLVGRLDPNKYYIPSSPSGGEWANDPRVGDTHTYDCVWQYPYKEFPNFVSEHIRTAPPVIYSLKKIIRGELWPEGYDGRFLQGDDYPMPLNWIERSHVGAMGHVKTGPYWEYYDADNAYNHIYRFAASYMQEMRAGLERVRMGGADDSVSPARKSKGHLSCKLNDTWPKVYCAVIDFFQEGFMPYYGTLRAQEPVLVCFDVRDEIKLWLVNDSADDIEGNVIFGLFDIERNEFAHTQKFAASVKQGESAIVYDLNELHFFKKTLVLYARFESGDGTLINTNINYADIERHYKFPDAKLEVTVKDGELIIQTDKFARCVEITGINGENEFGWLFSDNYFDLIPGEEKRVSVKSDTCGEITVKAHYSSHKTTVSY